MPVISDERLADLEKQERKLNALESGGVDNWDGYDFALEEIRKEDAKDEFLYTIADEIMGILGEDINEPAGRGAGFGFTPNADDKVVKYLKTLKIEL